jgi:hypothetical protein
MRSGQRLNVTGQYIRGSGSQLSGPRTRLLSPYDLCRRFNDQVVRIDGYHDSMSSIQSFLRPCDQTFRIKKGVSHKQVVGRADATHLILFS